MQASEFIELTYFIEIQIWMLIGSKRSAATPTRVSCRQEIAVLQYLLDLKYKIVGFGHSAFVCLILWV